MDVVDQSVEIIKKGGTLIMTCLKLITVVKVEGFSINFLPFTINVSIDYPSQVDNMSIKSLNYK